MAKNNFVVEVTFDLEAEKNISCIYTSKVSYKTPSIIFWRINCAERWKFVKRDAL